MKNTIFFVSLVANFSLLANDVFCDIIHSKKNAVILAENEYVIAIEKIPVRTPVDCLIIPKKHIKDMRYFELSKSEDSRILNEMFKMVQYLSRQLEGNGDCTVQINNGPESDQTVFHTHMHFKSKHKWKQKKQIKKGLLTSPFSIIP